MAPAEQPAHVEDADAGLRARLLGQLLADLAAHHGEHVIEIAPDVGMGEGLELGQEAPDRAGAAHEHVDRAELHAFQRFLLGAELAVGEELDLELAVAALRHELGEPHRTVVGRLARALQGRKAQDLLPLGVGRRQRRRREQCRAQRADELRSASHHFHASLHKADDALHKADDAGSRAPRDLPNDLLVGALPRDRSGVERELIAIDALTLIRHVRHRRALRRQLRRRPSYHCRPHREGPVATGAARCGRHARAGDGAP
jgi:hypothetical protein